MFNLIFSKWYNIVLFIMLMALASGFLTFAVMSILYVLIHVYGIMKFAYRKWVKRECPHFCKRCKYRYVCELKNPP